MTENEAMTYDCKKTGGFSGVWVFCELTEEGVADVSLELVSEGCKLGKELGCPVSAVVLGSGIRDDIKIIGGYGADTILLCESPLLKNYTTDAYAKVICDLVRERKPEILLFGATSIGRDLAPRCAARLHTGLTADCTHLDIDSEKYIAFLQENSTMEISEKLHEKNLNLKMTRPAFGGHLMATIICPRFRPQMSTVRPGALKKRPFDREDAESCTIERVTPALSEEDIRVKVLEVVTAATKKVNLTAADIIVTVGFGISKNPELGIRLAKQLADTLGGVLGASRAVVDAGWLPADHQVGQTGKTVRPKLYIALGVSGAIQHKAGMMDSEYIIAINKDDTAPIFEVADCGICADLFEAVPALIGCLQEKK